MSVFVNVNMRMKPKITPTIKDTSFEWLTQLRVQRCLSKFYFHWSKLIAGFPRQWTTKHIKCSFFMLTFSWWLSWSFLFSFIDRLLIPNSFWLFGSIFYQLNSSVNCHINNQIVKLPNLKYTISKYATFGWSYSCITPTVSLIANYFIIISFCAAAFRLLKLSLLI